MHADLGIALAKQAWLARDPICASWSCRRRSMPRAVSSVSRRLPDRRRARRACTRSRSATRRTRRSPTPSARACARRAGQVLCFLPGAGEIARARREIARRATAVPRRGRRAARVARRGGAGRGDSRPPRGARIILATNIAETSLTVPGVSAVVDTGLHKVARYDPERAHRQPRDRAHLAGLGGSAGGPRRAGSGRAWRSGLWHQARSAAAASRAGDPARRSVGDRCSTCSPGAAIRGRSMVRAAAAGADRIDAAFELLERLGARAQGS